MATTVNEMKRIIDAAILRLPRNIRNMPMRDFMTQFGGDVKSVVENDKKMNRCVKRRTLGELALAFLGPHHDLLRGARVRTSLSPQHCPHGGQKRVGWERHRADALLRAEEHDAVCRGPCRRLCCHHCALSGSISAFVVRRPCSAASRKGGCILQPHSYRGGCIVRRRRITQVASYAVISLFANRSCPASSPPRALPVLRLLPLLRCCHRPLSRPLGLHQCLGAPLHRLPTSTLGLPPPDPPPP